jgi:predicted NBD/HSP70 family sugar kinase
MSINALGIDIGGTHIRSISQTDSGRSEISRAKVATNFDSLVNQIIELAEPTKPKTIGITLPGRIENNLPAWIPNLSFIDGKDLASVINEKMPADIKLINDAQAALLAEAREGAAAGMMHVALIAIGTGIGGAVLLNGQIFTGNTGTAGSFGWMPAKNFDALQVTEPINSGPWEQVASGAVLVELADNWSSVDAMLADFKNGDATAALVVQLFAHRLGEGFAAIASVFDPEVIVVAGGVSAMLDLLSPEIDRVINYVASPTGRKVKFKQAALGIDAGVIGALIAGIESGK